MLAVLLVSGNTLLATGCTRPASQAEPTVPPAVELKLIADGFTSPVGLFPAPDATGRLFAIDQTGIIKIITADGTVLDKPFLDLRSRMVELNPRYDERGLLGMAFHPSFKQNHRFFVYYSAPLRAGGSGNHTSHVSEFRVSSTDPNQAEPSSERIILEIDEPQANHNAGELAFGPDGFLYISLGDGGGANDVGPGHSPMGNGQDLSTLLGKILRIDINGTEPYGIPADNPFFTKTGRDEIFAFGFRNPFRFSFDSGGNHELFVGDVGQGLWEEVDIVTKGNNYGWHIKEGTHGFNPQDSTKPPASFPSVDAAGQPLVDPIIEYQNAGGGGIGIAVIGGYVYRGTALPKFQGSYIFGDLSASLQKPAGSLFIATKPSRSGSMWTMQTLKINTSPDGHLNAFLRALARDASGELYALVAENIGPSGTTGKIYKIVP
ncbi:MAG: PQQ-dependent sugar dehydrogenase [Chloroflexi bacterium]|nr:PQQ-dependent sugar dehydrogenase [Chloroflexota bacterium]